MKNAHQNRAASRLSKTVTIADMELQPLSPRTWDILATTGHIQPIIEGYTPETQGFEPLYVIAYVHANANADDADSMTTEEIVANAKAMGREWDFETMLEVAQWLATQAEAITKAMSIAEPPKGRRGRKATTRTR